MRNTCFLCGKANGYKNVPITTRVPASQKAIQAILQHLGNCLKMKLVFQTSGVFVCRPCWSELVEYDKLMVKLLNYQQKLKQQLLIQLHAKSECMTEEEDEDDGKPNVIEMESESFASEIVDHMDDEDHLSDVLNPNLSTEDEFVTVDGRIIEIHSGDGVAADLHIGSAEFGKDDDEFIDDVLEKGSGEDDECEDDDETCSDISITTGKRRTGPECATCGEHFKTRSLLQLHIADLHKQKTYMCSICGVVRRDEEYLELHMNLHEGKTENQCRYCNKTFSRPMNTLRHMRKHWDQKKYQCEKCGERFSLDNMLYNHRMRHEAEENPLICSICNQSFKSRKTFNHHMTIHQANRPRHHCIICTKSFTERYTLKMHMKTHGDVLDNPDARNAVERVKEVVVEQHETEAAIIALETTDASNDTPTDEFSCVICTRKFPFKDLFEHHLQSEHDVILK